MNKPSWSAIALAWCLALPWSLSAVEVSIPTNSWISPLFIEGTTTDNVKVNGVPAQRLGGDHWFVNQVLTANNTTSVSVVDGTNAVSAQVTWNPFVAENPAFNAIALRVGDSLLLQALSQPIEVRKNTEVVAAIEPNATAPVSFRFPGIYTVWADDTVRLTVTVVGFDIDLSALAGNSLALQLRKKVTFTFPTAQALDGMVVGTNCDAASLTVTRIDAQKVSLLSQLSDVGVFPLWVRVGSNTGPVVFALPVHTYKFKAIRERVIPSTTPPSDVIQTYMQDSEFAKTLPPARYEVTFRLTPYRPDLIIDASRFAHRSTFLDGGSHFTVNTDGSVSSLGEPGMVTQVVGNKTVGEFTYTVFKPRNEVSTCVRIKALQILPEFSLILPVSSN
jgi:hypothetical protein